MGIEDFIKDALLNPNDYIAYHVGRELAKLHPGKAILEGHDGSFDLEEYVYAEKCALVHETSVFNHQRTQWEEPGKKLEEVFQNSWLNVLWRGQLLDVLYLTYSECCHRGRHHWIIAEDRKVAEEFFYDVCEWNSEVRGEVLVFEDGEWEKSKELYDSIQSATFDNLILREPLKQDLQDDFARFFAARQVYAEHGIPWKRGALFIGPPGNGKTHTVKALINQLQRPCLYVKGFKASYGTEQECVRRVFERARRTTPCLLVMEDIDSMIDNNNRSFFLNEMDGFSANTGVVVLATTNHPEKLDAAILDRPSRFDRKYYFALPGEAERGAYLAAWNANLRPELRISDSVTPHVVAKTEEFSFAYLKELVLSSMMQWMADDGSEPMDRVILIQATRLRAQMTAAEKSSGSREDTK
jgi:SpoVK/Ycf46/Vps4 family AAA+-type ATPase